MRIAIDARHLHTTHHSAYTAFTKEIISALSEQQPQHHFILLFDSAVAAANKFPANISVAVLTPKPKNLLSFKWWYDVKVATALKKNKAEAFIATYGLACLRTNIPQLLLVHDLSFLTNPSFFSKEGKAFYKRYTPGFLKTANAIATTSEFLAKDLQSVYNINEAKITVIGSGADEFYKPADFEQREKIKEQHSDGCEYFVFNGMLSQRSNIFDVLKAFSIFKKWQKTNMKLVLTGIADNDFKKDLSKLDTYKYRNEVVVRLNLETEEKAAVVAAAYAFVYPTAKDGFATPVLEALQCHLPVIAASDSSAEEIAADAGLYANSEKPEEIASHLKRIFKDEQLRNHLAETAKQQAKHFTWNKTTNALWQLIEKTVAG